MWPAGGGTRLPTIGSVCAASPISRASKVTAGWAGSSSSERLRCAATRFTPCICATACTKSGENQAVSPACVDSAVRRYRSAGSTTSSQWATESRKLATITVSATARLKEATTPLTATAALSRTRRARSTASSGNRRLRNAGAILSYSSATAHGRTVMPPTSSRPTER